MNWDVFLGIFTANHGSSKNGVGWGETCGDGQTREEVEFWNEGVD